MRHLLPHKYSGKSWNCVLYSQLQKWKKKKQCPGIWDNPKILLSMVYIGTMKTCSTNVKINDWILKSDKSLRLSPTQFPQIQCRKCTASKTNSTMLSAQTEKNIQHHGDEIEGNCHSSLTFEKSDLNIWSETSLWGSTPRSSWPTTTCYLNSYLQISLLSLTTQQNCQ